MHFSLHQILDLLLFIYFFPVWVFSPELVKMLRKKCCAGAQLLQQYKFRELGTLTFSLYLSQIPTVTACLVSSPSFCGKVKEEAEKKSCTVPVVLTQINFLQIWDFCFLRIWAAQANAFLIGRSATSANSLFSSVFFQQPAFSGHRMRLSFGFQKRRTGLKWRVQSLKAHSVVSIKRAWSHHLSTRGSLQKARGESHTR